MASELTKKKNSRRGHKAYVKKCMDEVRGHLEEYTNEKRARICHLKSALEDQLKDIVELDKAINSLLSEAETDEKDLDAEIEESAEFKAELKSVLSKINVVLLKEQKQASASPTEATENSHNEKSVKLPKLQMRKFNGRQEKWQEFWDAYEGAIHKNEKLSDVDKFTYLRGLLEEPARSTVAGFALTSSNYNDAIELLKRRFGKDEKIQRAHINELLNLKPVFKTREIMKLRRLYDTVEIHHRGLKALGVDEATYSTIVVSSILEKIPKGVRLSITRGKSYSTWNLDEMLKLLLEEIELREDQMTAHVYAKEDKEQRVEEKRSEKSGTANTFATATKGKDEKCAFCLETHKHEECTKVTSINKRKELIRKYGRCFTCLEKGHLSKNCNSNYSCKNCKNKHHVSICEAKSQGPQNGVMSDNALNDGNILGNDVTRNTSNHHVGSNCRVALQTAQAIIRGKRGVNVRVLFDSGSHRSFISERAASQAGLQSIRKEWIEISPFGQAVKDRGLKEVFKIDVMPIVGGNQVSMEAYAVPSISQIKNEHVEVRKKEYSHLKGLWFSDVCRDEEVFGYRSFSRCRLSVVVPRGQNYKGGAW